MNQFLFYGEDYVINLETGEKKDLFYYNKLVEVANEQDNDEIFWNLRVLAKIEDNAWKILISQPIKMIKIPPIQDENECKSYQIRCDKIAYGFVQDMIGEIMIPQELKDIMFKFIGLQFCGFRTSCTIWENRVSYTPSLASSTDDNNDNNNNPAQPQIKATEIVDPGALTPDTESDDDNDD